jgi:hypothetical protein
MAARKSKRTSSRPRKRRANPELMTVLAGNPPGRRALQWSGPESKRVRGASGLWEGVEHWHGADSSGTRRALIEFRGGNYSAYTAPQSSELSAGLPYRVEIAYNLRTLEAAKRAAARWWNATRERTGNPGGRRAARGKTRKRNAQIGVAEERPGRGRKLMSRRVLEVEYEHIEDADGVVRFHPFKTGVEMYALPDGSVLLKHRDGRPLWEDFR